MKKNTDSWFLIPGSALRQQSGRSMIEMLGYLALAGVVAVGAVALYQSVRARTARTTAVSELSEMAANAKLLFRGRGDYSTISVDYLVKAGALRSSDSPINNSEMTFESQDLGKSFAIVLSGLNFGDCAYFATAKLDWAAAVRINGFIDDAKSYCYEVEDNTLEFIVR